MMQIERIPYIIGYAFSAVTTVLAAEVSSGDPLSLFTSLGIGGLIAGVTYMWQRDTAKSRDKALELLAALTDGLREIKSSVDKSTEAHQAGTEATKEMLSVLDSLPPRETWVRIELALRERDRDRRD